MTYRITLLFALAAAALSLLTDTKDKEIVKSKAAAIYTITLNR